MAISTNSIIHYTDNFDALKNILSDGFKIKYCLEKLKVGDLTSNAAHPMISFCDIPLSGSQQHFDSYGKYGIGLTKEWAVKNGVNPVIYIDENSLFAKSIHSLLKERRNSQSNLNDEQKKEILKIKSYAKNYSGKLECKKKKRNNYKFYDEREWRLIPNEKTLDGKLFLVNALSFKHNKEYYNEKIKDIRIKFTLDDISYIIVEKTQDIPNLIEYLESAYKNEHKKKFQILLSKICSAEQIISDY